MEIVWSLTFVFIGGGTGSILRFMVERIITKQVPTDFPYATLFVNLVGSFLIGVLFVGMERYTLLTNHRLFMATGLLGGFTTFSTFTLDSVQMIRNASYASAISYILVSTILGLLFVLIGIHIAKVVFK